MDDADGPAAIVAPTTIDEFRERLAELTDTLPKRLRQCAEYVVKNLDRIAVSTVSELATGADVPPSAVMRFCQILGFSGFSEMQKLFRESYFSGWPDYSVRLQNLKDSGAGSPQALLGEFIEAGRLSLESLAASVDETALNDAVNLLVGAQTIHIVGFRRAFPVSTYLAYVFEKMSVPTLLHDGVGKLDPRSAMRRGDAMLAITFAPYSEETVALATDARDRGLPVVALTDVATSPLGRIADTVLTVHEVDFGAFRSLSATIALAISLAVAVASARESSTA